MFTHVSEFVPSAREPLIVQKIAAVGASGDASEGDGAHAQQGDAQHLRAHNHQQQQQGHGEERGQRMSRGGGAVEKRRRHGRLNPHQQQRASRADVRTRRRLSSYLVASAAARTVCARCCRSLSLVIAAPPPSLSPSLALSLSLSLTPRTGCLCAAENGSAHRAQALRSVPLFTPHPPSSASPQVRRTVMVAHCGLCDQTNGFIDCSLTFRKT